MRRVSFVIPNKPPSTKPEFMLMRVTLNGPLDSFRMGAGCQGNPPRDDRVGTFSPAPEPPGRKGVADY